VIRDGIRVIDLFGTFGYKTSMIVITFGIQDLGKSVSEVRIRCNE